MSMDFKLPPLVVVSSCTLSTTPTATTTSFCLNLTPTTTSAVCVCVSTAVVVDGGGSVVFPSSEKADVTRVEPRVRSAILQNAHQESNCVFYRSSFNLEQEQEETSNLKAKN